MENLTPHLTSDELDRLTQIARAGVPAEWKAERANTGYRILFSGRARYGKHWDQNNEWEILGWVDGVNASPVFTKEDAAHIAAFHPTQCLSLIEELTALRGENERLTKALDDAWDILSEDEMDDDLCTRLINHINAARHPK